MAGCYRKDSICITFDCPCHEGSGIIFILYRWELRELHSNLYSGLGNLSSGVNIIVLCRFINVSV